MHTLTGYLAVIYDDEDEVSSDMKRSQGGCLITYDLGLVACIDLGCASEGLLQCCDEQVPSTLLDSQELCVHWYLRTADGKNVACFIRRGRFELRQRLRRPTSVHWCYLRILQVVLAKGVL